MPSRSAGPAPRRKAARVDPAWARVTGVTTALALAAAPARAQAQGTMCTRVPLRDALEQLAAAASVRLSYSRELLAVDRPVCAPVAGQPVLVALDSLLQGTGVEAVSVGGGQIVLAPSAHATGEAAGPAGRPAVLDRVVVTGSPAGAPSRALPVALSVVDGTGLGPRAAASLATALDGVVPGLWLWSQPTTALFARYAGLRGASSFGLTTPKLYIDGVEVANPLFVTSLSPDQIERIEVIRGPQGAALYGADAISGVINVITRHDGAQDGRAITLRSGVGAAATAFVPRPAFAQDHGLTFRTGTGAQTAGFSVGLATLGPVVPGSTAHQFTALADTRRIVASGVFTFTARFADAVAPTDSTALAAVTSGSNGRLATLQTQHVSELTLAANAVRTTGGRWTQTFTAGLDGYRLSGVSTPPVVALPQRADSAQGTTRGTAARGTLRATTTATYDVARAVALTVTGIADYGLLRDATRLDSSSSYVQPASSAWDTAMRHGRDNRYANGWATVTPVTWLGTAGLVGQTTLAWHDAVFVTAGIRGERNDGFTASSRTALLPSLGVSTVWSLGGATLKLRTAYGSGLRPVRTAARDMSWRAFGGGALPASLAPESQTGIEGGADLFVGSATRAGTAGTSLAVHLTGFDQRASGLIQQVQLAPNADTPMMPPPTPSGTALSAHDAAFYDNRGPGRGEYMLQDVGAISNRGVEGEAQLRAVRGPSDVITLGGTVTYVDSRVQRTAGGYTGELRAGDRVLEVPRWTFGLNANWRVAGWGVTVGASRAANWINYSRLALAAASDTVTGAGLRAYWRKYPGVTRLRADFTRDLSRGLSAVLTGENLLNYQRGEPDDLTTLPGRTLTAGVRARF